MIATLELPDDPEQLRLCMVQLATLATLPRSWFQLPGRAVVEDLVGKLRLMVGADIVYAHIADVADLGALDSVAGVARGTTHEALRHAVMGAPPGSIIELAGAGPSPLRVALFAIDAAGSVLAAGAHDPAFPNVTQRLLLTVGASHLDMAIERRRSATILADEARILEERVAREIEKRAIAEQALQQAQKMELIGQLTGGIAHDFNNLLTVVIGNIETLRRRAPRIVEFDRLAETALSSAERAATLTQQLLAFARRQPLDPKPLDANRLVAGMSNLLRRVLGERVAIETILSGGLWLTVADANQLESAILNLAVNARDAIAGPGKLTIETANAVLDAAYAAAEAGEVAPGEYVLVAVTDTGAGMTKEIIAQAFEPFFTTKAVGRGTGLGLSQVYGFIKQSGGHVKILSEPGQGTTVKLYLPRLAAAAAETAALGEAPPVPTAKHNETILVVEDDTNVRRYAVDILRELGYTVLHAGDAAGALELLSRSPGISLLFSDIGLPGGLDGRQLAEEARRRQPGLKVLFTTGYARNVAAPFGPAEASTNLIVKPFTYAALAMRIRRVLDG